MPSYIVSAPATPPDNMGGQATVVATDEQDAKNQGATLFKTRPDQIEVQRYEQPAWDAWFSQ